MVNKKTLDKLTKELIKNNYIIDVKKNYNNYKLIINDDAYKLFREFLPSTKLKYDLDGNELKIYITNYKTLEDCFKVIE